MTMLYVYLPACLRARQGLMGLVGLVGLGISLRSLCIYPKVRPYVLTPLLWDMRVLGF